MGGFDDWFKALPPVSRGLLVTALVSTVLTSFKIVSPLYLILNYSAVWKEFQIWRLVTNFLWYGNFSMPFLFNIMMLYRQSIAYENNPFSTGGNNSSDFLVALIFGGICMLLIGLIYPAPLFSMSMVFMIVYIWSRQNANHPMSFFGFQFKGGYYPWVMAGFSLVIGGDIIGVLIGIAVGHLYYMLVEIIPRKYGKEFIKTPRFM
eukprot:TRINITY_DN4150_c0_g1_i2.p1 TRINITY_DN4150_c0_g1~~TRINITY_DN4150_c0_g1_i2.p1  ORF type:complete len:205 (-),score=33.94 TRINITY_DN4150_c0_g1_i2:347-961(-)